MIGDPPLPVHPLPATPIRSVGSLNPPPFTVHVTVSIDRHIKK